MEVTINGVKKEVSKEEMKDRVIGYYDARDQTFLFRS